VIELAKYKLSYLGDSHSGNVGFKTNGDFCFYDLSSDFIKPKTKLKPIKAFELYTGTGSMVDYEVGDVVVCINDKTKTGAYIDIDIDNGKKYKVIKIYQILEDKYLGNKFMRVDIQDLETGEITLGWESTRFKLEMEFDADKYNM